MGRWMGQMAWWKSPEVEAGDAVRLLRQRCDRSALVAAFPNQVFEKYWFKTVVSDQPHALQRGMSVASNDDVIMNGDAQ
jgi:hypothetical protein